MMNKMLVATALMTILGLSGCATTEAPEAPRVAVADAGKTKVREPELTTGSRIPGTRSNMVSATSAADAQKQLRDNATPFKMPGS